MALRNFKQEILVDSMYVDPIERRFNVWILEEAHQVRYFMKSTAMECSCGELDCGGMKLAKMVLEKEDCTCEKDVRFCVLHGRHSIQHPVRD